MKVDENEDTHDKFAFNIEGREGLFIEKADLIDKFIRRPGPKNPYMDFEETDADIEDLCLVQYAKMMEMTQRLQRDPTVLYSLNRQYLSGWIEV